MARQPRRIAGLGASDLPTRAAIDGYVGPSREVVSDGETLRLHDGVTPGGIRMARAGRRAVADMAYVALAADSYIGVTALTAARSVTLPPAAAFAPGQALYVADESGACNDDAGLRITIAASGADKIGTLSGLVSSVVLGSPYQKLTFHSNGSNLWTFA